MQNQLTDETFTFLTFKYILHSSISKNRIYNIYSEICYLRYTVGSKMIENKTVFIKTEMNKTLTFFKIVPLTFTPVNSPKFKAPLKLLLVLSFSLHFLECSSHP